MEIVYNVVSQGYFLGPLLFMILMSCFVCTSKESNVTCCVSRILSWSTAVYNIFTHVHVIEKSGDVFQNIHTHAYGVFFV